MFANKPGIKSYPLYPSPVNYSEMEGCHSLVFAALVIRTFYAWLISKHVNLILCRRHDNMCYLLYFILSSITHVSMIHVMGCVTVFGHAAFERW